MDNNRFINLETFEVTENIPNYIMVDKEIANTIAVLNKKGYKTLNSCSGHFKEHRKSLQEKVDLYCLEEAKNNKIYDIEEIQENAFSCWILHCRTSIYIMFEKKYEFPSLPEGFELESLNIIRCTIELLDNGKLKEKEIIYKEIEKYNKILEDWANNLPDIN